MNIEFEAGVLWNNTEKLYKKLSELYGNFKKDEIEAELTSRYCELKKEEKISVVFVGQYSSGKSTIIKALTGENDIKIDSDIATGEVTAYDWGSVHLVDTPGIKTGEKEEHDAMTMDAIEHADLLVYCITSDLFSTITTSDFKNLAEKYRSKLFLMVNKMNAEVGGYDDLIEEYTDTINKTLAPNYSIGDFHHFFVDAKDYLTGKTENDQDYISDSHFNEFIGKLNDFIKLHGLKGKLLTPVSTLIDSVENSLNALEDDEHIREGKTITKKIIDAIEEKKRAFIKAANDDVQRTSNKYIQKGDDVAFHLGEKGYEFDEKAFKEFSDEMENRLCQNIQGYFELYANEVDEKVNEIKESEMARHFFKEQELELGKDFKGNDYKSEKLAELGENITKASNLAVPKVTSWFGKIANIPESGKVTIWSVNGSDLHKIVKEVGHKLGHKFKPFEALKITKKISSISKVLGPALTGVGAVVECAMWLAEKLGEKKAKKVKDDVKETFKCASDEVLKGYHEQISMAACEFDKIRDSLQKDLDEYDNEASKNSDFGKQLISVKEELKELKYQIEG